MAAGVGPSSTVARQTPVRKHVVGGSGRVLARDLHPFPAMDRISFASLSTTSSRVRAAAPIVAHSPAHRGGCTVTMSFSATSRETFFPEEIVARTSERNERRNESGR
jgi:hypothetical protein